jgi:hypothetical protein
MRPTPEELTDVWLYVYSRTSLLEADSAIDALSSLPAGSDTVAQALMCSIVVAYARPFTKSQITKSIRTIPLKGIRPPRELAATHCLLLELRNKVFGHKDAIPSKGHAKAANIVLIRRVPSDFHLHASIVAEISPALLTQVRDLCAFFVAHCVSRLTPFITQYKPEIMQQPEGWHELVVCEPPDQWLRRHDKA